MIEINLLDDRKKKEKVRREFDATKPLFYFAFVVVLGAVLAVDIHYFTKLSNLRKERVEYENKRRAPAHLAKLAEAQELDKRLDRLNKKQIIIDELITNRINWAQKLGALRDTLPGDIWIEKVALMDPANPRTPFQTLEIDAATLHHERGLFRTAETMENLGDSEEFMAGFSGDLEDVESRSETWERTATEGLGMTRIWRFKIQAKRPLPESELQK